MERIEDLDLRMKSLEAYVDHLAERIQSIEKWCIEHDVEGQAYGRQYEEEMADLKSKLNELRNE